MLLSFFLWEVLKLLVCECLIGFGLVSMTVKGGRFGSYRSGNTHLVDVLMKP